MQNKYENGDQLAELTATKLMPPKQRTSLFFYFIIRTLLRTATGTPKGLNAELNELSTIVQSAPMLAMAYLDWNELRMKIQSSGYDGSEQPVFANKYAPWKTQDTSHPKLTISYI